jgi:AsmA protein
MQGWRSLAQPVLKSLWLKMAGLFIVALLVGALGLRLLGPYIISTPVVRTALEEAITEWSGYKTVIGGETDIAYWPVPRIILNDVRIYADDSAPNAPLARADIISANYGFLSMLRGHPDFYNLEIFRPEITIERAEDGHFNWKNRGRIAEAIAFFNPGNDPTRALPQYLNAKVGKVSVVDGTAVFKLAKGRDYHFTHMGAEFNWAQLSDTLSMNAHATLFGTEFSVEFSTENPLALLAGQNTDVSMNINSRPLSAQFSGIANIFKSGFVSGSVELSAPSLAEPMSWFTEPVAAAYSINNIKLKADMAAGDSVVRLDNLALSLDGTNATGVLDISRSDDRLPKITGTLAFDQFNILAFLQAFSPFSTFGRDASLVQQMNLDLRISSQVASFHTLSLTNVGAGARIENGRASLDIGDSQFLGGTLTARLAISDDDTKGKGELHVMARNIDLEALDGILKIPGPWPLANGSLELNLKTGKPLIETRLDDISGMVRMTARRGTLRGFDETEFRKKAANKAFFNLGDVDQNGFAFNTLAMEATFQDGIANVKNANIASADTTINLNGVIPYPTMSLALAGTLRPTKDSQTVEPALNFFIGGSWPDAVISPVETMLNGLPQ